MSPFPPGSRGRDRNAVEAGQATGARDRLRLAPGSAAGRVLRAAGAVLIAFHAALWVLAALAGILLRFANPPITALMLDRRLVAGVPSRPLDFVPLSSIPRYARSMFVRLEDNTFYEHPGVEVRALREAWRVNRELGFVYRGGSTIPMQLARTLFLTQSRTYLRKYMEAWIALEMDLLLPKGRILELYLNTIEFGPGVYGIGAAARYHFHEPASRLQRDDYRRLATIVASPLRYNTTDFRRRRALAERYDYLLAAFPDPGTPPAQIEPPPPPPREEEPSRPEVKAGVVVPETQGGGALPENRQPPQNP